MVYKKIPLLILNYITSLEGEIMEGIFTLPYSEYDAIHKMSKLLKKSDGYGFYIPTSRQQKGVDFLVMNHKTNKTLRVQVKSSRSYYHEDTYFLWFNNFLERYDKGNCDLYVLYGLYPNLKKGEKVTSKKKAWGSILLCFTEIEMFELLKQVRTKKEDKSDKFFGVKFKDADEIFTERGFVEEKNLTEHLIENYAKEIKSMLK